MYHHPAIVYPATFRIEKRSGTWTLTLLSILTMLVATLGAIALSFSVAATINSSGVLKAATAEAAKSPIVQRTLGTPIELAGFPSGTVSFERVPHANVVIPLEGPKGQGKLHVVADQREGKWVFTSVVFEKGRSKSKLR